MGGLEPPTFRDGIPAALPLSYTGKHRKYPASTHRCEKNMTEEKRPRYIL